MPWILFTADVVWYPTRNRSVHYRAGEVHLVSRACAERSRAAGRAEPAKKPERTDDGD